MQLTAVFTYAEEGGFVALNPETGTTTQGESIEEALENLQEATALDLEEFSLTVSRTSLVTSFTVPTHA
ncbi:MAG: type II toxin-antitoxin system HicB family antitoxin [Methylococcaceae bacterium]|nr:type II toxin-antitoxin system HicB family antitoxin [Methylococcaceae bacterium]